MHHEEIKDLEVYQGDELLPKKGDKVEKPATKFSNDYKLIRDKLTDVDIIINDKVFKCHMLLLKSTSQYFVSGCEFKESQVEKVKKFNLSDSMNAEDFKHIMDYLYDRNFKVNETNCKSVIMSSSFLQMEQLQRNARNKLIEMAKEKCDGPTYDLLNLYYESWIKSRMPWRVSRNFKRVKTIDCLEFQYCIRLPAHRLVKLLRLGDYLNIHESYILRVLLFWREFNLSSPTINADFRDLIMYIRNNNLTESEIEIIDKININRKTAISFSDSIKSLNMKLCKVAKRKSPSITMVGMKGIYTIENHSYLTKRYEHNIQPKMKARKPNIDKWFGRGELLVVSNDRNSLFSDTNRYDCITNELHKINMDNENIVCSIVYGEYDIIVAKDRYLYYGKSDSASSKKLEKSIFVSLKEPYNKKINFFSSHKDIVYMYNNGSNCMYMIKAGDKEWSKLPELLHKHNKPCVMATECGIYVFAGYHLRVKDNLAEPVIDCDDNDVIKNDISLQPTAGGDNADSEYYQYTVNGHNYRAAAQPEFYSIVDKEWKSIPIVFTKKMLSKLRCMPWKNNKFACDSKHSMAFYVVNQYVIRIKLNPDSLSISQHAILSGKDSKCGDLQLIIMNMPTYNNTITQTE